MESRAMRAGKSRKKEGWDSQELSWLQCKSRGVMVMVLN